MNGEKVNVTTGTVIEALTMAKVSVKATEKVITALNVVAVDNSVSNMSIKMLSKAVIKWPSENKNRAAFEAAFSAVQAIDYRLSEYEGCEASVGELKKALRDLQYELEIVLSDSSG